MLVTLDSKDEGEGDGPADGARNRDNRELTIVNSPFLLIEQFEQHG